MPLKINRAKPEDSQTERYIMIALIVSEGVCRNLYPLYNSDYFQTKLTKEVSKWCIEFFENYETAPQQELQTIFEMKSKAGRIDPDLEEEIEKFLANLSEEYENWQDFNEHYYIEMGRDYFKKRSFSILADQIKQATEDGDSEEAEQVYSNFVQVQKDLSTTRDVTNPDEVESMQKDAETKPSFLFQPPGAFGRVTGPINRRSFIGVIGGEKSGKTYCMQAFAIPAVRQGCNVAIIETGDLSQPDLDNRFNSYWTKKVPNEYDEGYHYEPVMDCIYNQLNECEHAKAKDLIAKRDNEGKIKFNVTFEDDEIYNHHEPCIECWKDRRLRYKFFKGSIWWQKKYISQWTWGEVKQRMKQFRKWHKRGRIITDAFPMYSVSASDIRNWCINKQKQEGFIPDVLIVDYPDIMIPEKNEEYRHQENRKWMILRQISQEFDICVIVPTQADAKSYNKDSITLDNFSEDKRKYGHVTHFFAINKNKTEEQLGCARFDRLLLRENSAKIVQQATMLQFLTIDHPHIGSFFGRVPSLS